MRASRDARLATVAEIGDQQATKIAGDYMRRQLLSHKAARTMTAIAHM